MNVDFVYYSTVYMGKETDETSFPALCARAEDVIGAMVRWKDPSTFTPFQMTMYKKAVCAQVDYFAVNGLESVAGSDGRGFTVGKVSVNGVQAQSGASSGAMAHSLSNLVMMYLEQSGLLNPAVPVVGGCVC